MRIVIDTEKGLFIVPKTFEDNLKKQNDVLKKRALVRINLSRNESLSKMQ